VGSPNSDEGHTLWYSLYVRTLWLTVLLSGVASTDYRSYIYGHIHNMCKRDICIYVQGAGMENNNNCSIEGRTSKICFLHLMELKL
jgi:hypothetical protein